MRVARTFFLLGFLISAHGYLYSADQRDVLFQVSTIGSLLKGLYDGNMSCGELKQHGDFGLGTFDHLDGEMIVVDGMVFQIRSDGKALPVPDGITTPFAVVTFFDRDSSMVLERPMDYVNLQHFLDSSIQTRNIPYALKIEGKFTYMKTRSVPKQNKPYLPLVEVIKVQPVFQFRDVPGVMVGFRSPDYLEGVNVPGYHFHFITDDRSAGGHVLECLIERVIITIDSTPNFFMALPEDDTFFQTDFGEKANAAGIKME